MRQLSKAEIQCVVGGTDTPDERLEQEGWDNYVDGPKPAASDPYAIVATGTRWDGFRLTPTGG